MECKCDKLYFESSWFENLNVIKNKVMASVKTDQIPCTGGEKQTFSRESMLTLYQPISSKLVSCIKVTTRSQ